MSKVDELNRLLESADESLKRYNELTEVEKDELIKNLAIAQQISAEQNYELFQQMQESIKKMEKFDEQFDEMQASLAAHDAFLLEKGLGDEFEDFVEAIVSDYVSKVQRSKFTVVQ